MLQKETRSCTYITVCVLNSYQCCSSHHTCTVLPRCYTPPFLRPTSRKKGVGVRVTARTCAKPRPLASHHARMCTSLPHTTTRITMRVDLLAQSIEVRRQEALLPWYVSLRRNPAWCSATVSFRLIILPALFSDPFSVDTEILRCFCER